MELDVSALESTDDALAIAEEPGFGIWERIVLGFRVRCTGAAGGSITGLERVVIEPAKYDDLLTGHEHEILWLGSRVVDEGGAGANAALLQGEAGPGVECVCVHLDESDGWMG